MASVQTGGALPILQLLLHALCLRCVMALQRCWLLTCSSLQTEDEGTTFQLSHVSPVGCMGFFALASAVLYFTLLKTSSAPSRCLYMLQWVTSE